MADECEDDDERVECAVPLPPCQKQYGKRNERPYNYRNSPETCQSIFLGCCYHCINIDFGPGSEIIENEFRPCAAQPDDVCAQIEENKPLPTPNSDIEKDFCDDLLEGFALEVMGWKEPRQAKLLSRDGEVIEGQTVLVGDMIKPILPSTLDSTNVFERYGEGINPVLKVEVTKKMCSLKEYSFTIGD